MIAAFFYRLWRKRENAVAQRPPSVGDGGNNDKETDAEVAHGSLMNSANETQHPVILDG